MAQWLRIRLSMQETQETWVRSLGQKDPWKRKWQSFSVFLPGKSLGQRSLVGCSPWCQRVRHDWVTRSMSVCTSLLLCPFAHSFLLCVHNSILWPWEFAEVWCVALLTHDHYLFVFTWNIILLTLSLPIFLRDFVLDICLVCSIQLNFILWSNQCILKGVFSQSVSSVTQSCPTLWPHRL